jgi:exopolysaccharide biosynthesis protein
MKKLLKAIGWIFLFVITAVAAVFLTLYLLMRMFCYGPSESARDTFVSTMLETGGMKFVISWFFTDEEVMEITGANDPVLVASDTDADLVNISSADDVETQTDDGQDETEIPEALLAAYGADDDGDGLILVPITAHTFSASLLVIRDPSNIHLSSSYPWSTDARERNGLTVGQHCEQSNAIAGINAGEYVTSGTNWGGKPVGVVVEDGEILYNGPTYGDVMVGFNEDTVLVVKDVGGMSAASFQNYVTENHITDAASFKDISGGNINHFTKLIINGEAVELGGKGSGANPRTAIAQCADGTVLFLCTDGRGTGGHLGATGQDLIDLLIQYGAVNAANLDGGSSSALFFNGEYTTGSTHMLYADTSRNVPTAFVVMK